MQSHQPVFLRMEKFPCQQKVKSTNCDVGPIHWAHRSKKHRPIAQVLGNLNGQPKNNLLRRKS